MRPFDETRAELIGRKGEVLAALSIVPSRRGHIRCPLPSHDDRNPSWRWDDRRGRWHCTCGGGDIFDLVQAMGRAHDTASAMAFVREVLGLPPIGERRQETAEQRAARVKKQAELQAQADARRRQREAEEADYARQQRVKAFRMWMRRQPGVGSIVERYLRSRGITCPLPGTLAYLRPARPDHHPAMIAAFGIPDEPELGVLRLPPMRLGGVHLTLLKPDGSGKARNADGHSKLTIGVGHDLPIVLAPPNDLGGLVVAEGIEDALSAHQATGLGAWAAGTANRLPGLAPHVPDYIEAVTIQQDDDPAGRHYSEQLAEAVAVRGIDVFISKAGVHGS
jgi:Toprim domain